MGKRDTRYAFMNPIALARARGSSTSSGPTIRDYLNRSRPSWEEVKKVLQQRREGCSTLAAWENFQDDLNKKYNSDLKRKRKMLLKKKTPDKLLIKAKEKVSRLFPSSSSSLNSSISNPHSKARDEHQVNKKRQKSECDVKKEKKERKINELKKNRKNDHKKHKNKVKKHQK